MIGTPASAASVASALIALALMAAVDAHAQTSPRDAALSARAQFEPRPPPRRVVRVRPRITVTPTYPYRVTPTDYPTPYPIEYPGPGAVRECRSWLAQELRPSGAVIVPRMNCWWVRR
jgi:hypothetical protein